MSCALATPTWPTCRPAAACGPSSSSRNIPDRSVRRRCNDGEAVVRRAQRRMTALRPSLVLFLLAATTAARAEPAAALVEAGATIYGDYCSSCHGDGLRNTSGGVTFDLRRPRDRKGVVEGKGRECGSRRSSSED